MGLFKCKMCGAELPVTEGAKIVECEYCGTSQTIATSNDDKILKLYARGNLLRTQNEFDKAYSIFEQIVAENPKDAEAYWNLLLCKYGVTYVDDYDGSKKPTISRMSMTSIKEDVDYKNVIEYADEVTKKVYEKQINEISLIQENILNIVKKEKPYDIFISYKETDEFGDRTEDSVLAQDIYDALTKEGYKVFLSRITLSGVIGSEYEPYIYSALYSSKVMLLVTTSEEYVNAVWVKNEWSRFLKMMKEDSSKKLIPCFKTIDAYDLPKEVRNIQSVNFDKLGAIQDLIIGVNKILGKQEEIPTRQVSPFQKLYDRLEELVNKANFKDAQTVLDQLIVFEPENEILYLYKLLIDTNSSSFEVAKTKYKSIISNVTFKKIKNSNNPKIKEFVEGIYEYLYTQALSSIENNSIKFAIDKLNLILDYKDSKDLLTSICEPIYIQGHEDLRNEKYREARRNFEKIIGYKDSKHMLYVVSDYERKIARYKELKREIEAIFNSDALSLMFQELSQLIKELENLKYGDCEELAEKYYQDLGERSAKTKNKKGCYVATCVYGSYDCKEVWSLRRYRDNYLDSFLLGRLFIKLYYKVSPKLVELFGDKEWFRKPIKKILDRKVKKLKNKGYEDTPYSDKY